MFKLILMGTFAALMAVAAASAQSPYPTPKPDGTARIQRSGTCPTGTSESADSARRSG